MRYGRGWVASRGGPNGQTTVAAENRLRQVLLMPTPNDPPPPPAGASANVVCVLEMLLQVGVAARGM